MRKAALLPMHRSPYQDIQLDSIINAALARLMRSKNNRNHKLTQDWWLLRQILYQLFWRNPFQLYIKNPFNTWSTISQAALGAKVGLSREWTNKLIRRLREAGWIATSAPKKPDGKQEPMTLRPGGKLQELIVAIDKSLQKNRVNTQSQSFPNSSLLEPKQTERQTDSPIPKRFMEGIVKGLVKSKDMNEKIRW